MRLIVVEGIDGTGKTTLVSGLLEQLKCTRLRFPSDHRTGRLIRKLLSNPGESFDPSARAVASLFSADFHEGVKHAAGSNNVVIADRYVHSSLAYNCDRILDEDFVREINGDLPKPALALWLDAPVPLCLERLRERGRLDATERADVLFRARNRYAELVGDPEWPVVRIDASRPAPEVLFRALRLIEGARLA